jgi:hypothetical protein
MLQSQREPYNLFKDPTGEVQTCRACGEPLMHNGHCLYSQVEITRYGTLGRIFPTPVLKEHLTSTIQPVASDK